MKFNRITAALSCLVLANTAFSTEVAPISETKAEPAAMVKPITIPADKKHYSPNVGDTFPNNVFFCD